MSLLTTDNDIVARASALRVRTPEDYIVAGQLSVAIASLRKQVKAMFEPMIKASHAAHKAATDGFKAQDAPLEAALKYLDVEIKAFRKQQREEAEAAARAAEIEAAVLAEEAGEVTVLAVPEVATATQVRDLSFRKVVRFEVVDPDAVPREFLSPDPVKIKARIDTLGMAASIPGVYVYEDEIAVRRG